MLKRFLLASAMLFVPLTTFAQNATTQVNGANLNGNPVTILTPWVPNGDGTYSQKVAGAGGGSGSNAAAGLVNTTAPASASYTGFLSGANIVPVSATNPLPISGTISATTTANATAAAPTYTSGSNPLSVDFAGNLRVGGTFYQATQPVSATALPLPTGAATAALQTTINTTLGTPFQAGGSVGNTAFGISGTLPAFAVIPTVNVGTMPTTTVTGTVAVTGAYQTTQPVSGTVAVTGAYQTTQPVSLAALPALTTGANAIGSITNTAFGISGTLPAFAATPTVNVGTMPTTTVTGTVAVTGAYQATQPVSLAALPALATGSNAIGSVTNTAFGISGTLPAFAATPTVNIGTAPTIAVTGALTGYVSARVIQQTPTVTAATAYATGQVIGTLLTFANAGRAAGGNGTLQDAVVLFADSQTQPMDLIIFSANPTATTIADRGAFALATADVTKVLRVIHLSDISSLGTPSIAELHGLATKYVADGSGNLYGVLVARGTPTFGTATGVTIQIGVETNA